MKRRLWLLAAMTVMLLINCSEVPENNDPILGTWHKELSDTSIQKQEWIFNDVYLGRYTEYGTKGILFETDFKWELSETGYTLSYPGTDRPPIWVTLESLESGSTALMASKTIVAIRSN
ncbi:hypothetical protein [Sediminicola luteus]|nr:hypothetical protein [Sediminicola luteus]